MIDSTSKLGEEQRRTVCLTNVDLLSGIRQTYRDNFTNEAALILDNTIYFYEAKQAFQPGLVRGIKSHRGNLDEPTSVLITCILKQCQRQQSAPSAPFRVLLSAPSTSLGD